MRRIATVASALLAFGAVSSAPAAGADPAPCDDAFCTPGIAPGIVLGSYCGDPAYYVFGTLANGRLVFCGSPRRKEPRWFRSPLMMGVKAEGSVCSGYDDRVAQAPDGLFLACTSEDGAALWRRGDL